MADGNGERRKWEREYMVPVGSWEREGRVASGVELVE